MYNNHSIIGRLVRDPELRYSPSGVGITNFSVAVERARKNQQGEKVTDFFNCRALGKLAENAANYLSKGKLAFCAGEHQIDKYQKDGVDKEFRYILCDTIRFLSPKSGEDFSGMGSEVDYNDDDGPPF